MKPSLVPAMLVAVLCISPLVTVASARQSAERGQPSNGNGGAVPPVVPAGYVIGADDMLGIVFWRDKDMSADVVVRPDGKISLPLLNDIDAAGYTPEQLRARIEQAASKYIEEPNATVIVKAINSRKVFIVGSVARPGTYPLTGDMNVLQLIALAGGLLEYADSKNIMVMRKEDGRDVAMKFHYDDVVRQKKLEQNISLKPGDTVVVR
jgi:polysaccharide export outer membrane protein